MRTACLWTLLLFAITHSNISDFTTKENALDNIGDKGAVCFVNWDEDELVDILWVDNGSSVLKFYKNTGTLSAPSYTDMGNVKNEAGESLQFYHG